MTDPDAVKFPAGIRLNLTSPTSVDAHSAWLAATGQSSAARTKQQASHPDHIAAFLHRDDIVAAHAHRQRVE